MRTTCSLIVIGAAFVEALVIRELWRWFVAPLGMPVLSYGQAFGLSILFGLLAFKSSQAARMSDDTDEIVASQAGWAIGAPLVAWAAGAVCHALTS